MRVLELQAILSKIGKCGIAENLMGLRWKKVLINATTSGLSAALGCEFGWYLDRDEAKLVLAYAADEVARIVHAKGYRMSEPGETQDYDTCVIEPNETAWDKLEFWHLWGITARDLKASMLQDLEKGKPCEVDYINGVVIEAGKELGN